MTELYEQMRGTALSTKKVGAHGLGILTQKGFAIWLKTISDFQPAIKQKPTAQDHCRSNYFADENNVFESLTNILSDITLRKVREQISL